MHRLKPRISYIYIINYKSECALVSLCGPCTDAFPTYKFAQKEQKYQ